MAKKLKLNLKNLEVQSFVTSLNDDEKKIIQGGATLGFTRCVSECDCSEEVC
jgi:hypothetical protein